MKPFKLNPERSTSTLLLLLLIVQPACAARGAPSDTEHVFMENASADAIRVSMDFGEREVLLGRVAPLSSRSFSLRSRLSPAMLGARIRILPLGVPTISVTSEGTADFGIYSDWYRPEEFIGSAWRYSGSVVLNLRTGGR